MEGVDLHPEEEEEVGHHLAPLGEGEGLHLMEGEGLLVVKACLVKWA